MVFLSQHVLCLGVCEELGIDAMDRPFLLSLENYRSLKRTLEDHLVHPCVGRGPRWDYLACCPIAPWKPPVLDTLPHPWGACSSGWLMVSLQEMSCITMEPLLMQPLPVAPYFVPVTLVLNLSLLCASSQERCAYPHVLQAVRCWKGRTAQCFARQREPW